MLDYSHTMIGTADLSASAAFYRDTLGLLDVGRSADGRTIYLAAAGDFDGTHGDKLISIGLSPVDADAKALPSPYRYVSFCVEAVEAATVALAEAGFADRIRSQDNAVAYVVSPEGFLVELSRERAARPATVAADRAEAAMHYLHTTVFTPDLDHSLRFWSALGMRVVRELIVPGIEARAAFVAGPRDEAAARSPRFAPTLALVERTPEKGPVGISHICFRVSDLYATCQALLDKGVSLKMPPRDGFRAMVRAPEGAVIEFHQAGERKAPSEPWLSMADGV